MVELRQRNETEAREWAEHYIPHLIDLWEELPEIAAEIDAGSYPWSPEYIAEWPLYEDQRGKLKRYKAQGILTAKQTEQIHYLDSLVAQHKSTLDWLLSERPQGNHHCRQEQ